MKGLLLERNKVCIPITFNNPLKVCLSDKKYTTQTRPTQIVKVHIFLIEKPGFNGLLKIIGGQI
jgi:hypothetical protein